MKRTLSYVVIILPVLIGVIFLFLPLPNIQSRDTLDYQTKTVENPSKIEPEKLIFLLQYIGIDYNRAVENRRVINKSEYQEMVEFSRIAMEWYTDLRPQNEATPTLLKLQKLSQLIKDKAESTEVRVLTNGLIQKLSMEFNVISYPLKKPNLAQGKLFYNNTCATCHGLSGNGRGDASKGLLPPPSNFQNPQQMNKVTPYQMFNAVTYGVNGTSMPSYQQAFSAQERWNIAFYLMTLRSDFLPQAPKQSYDIFVKDLAVSSNDELIHRLKTSSQSGLWAASEDAYWLGTVDYFRQNPPQLSSQERLLFTQQKLNQSFSSYQRGQSDKAVKLALEAYLEGLEFLEPELLQRDPSLVAKLEKEFSNYRNDLKLGASILEIKQQYRNLLNILEDVKFTLEPSEAAWSFAFVQSLTILLREGIEAALLIAVLITYLVANGYSQLRKYVTAGALSGIALGGLTWMAARFFIEISQFQQEALEGLTSLLAASVLLSVSLWIIHNIDVQRWKMYIRSKAEKALGAGSGVALATVAFLAVYREAFESVLFYQALWLRSTTVQSGVVLGFLFGCVLLTLLITLIFKFGLRIPLKSFFGFTGLLLGFLAFVFAGYGVRELQNIGWLKETFLPWDFKWSLLEIHPTIEGLALQFGILLSFLLGWFIVYFQKINSPDKIKVASSTATS
jgi:high-affinity iron transporter